MSNIKKIISIIKETFTPKKTGIINKKVKNIICECGINPNWTKSTESEGKIYNDFECTCGKVYRKLDKNIIYI